MLNEVFDERKRTAKRFISFVVEKQEGQDLKANGTDTPF